MSRKEALCYALGALAMVGAVALGVLPEPAMAAASSGIGGNLGDEVKSWGTALLTGTAALVGLPALAKRDIKESLVIAVIVLILGGFLFAEKETKSVVDSFWSALAR